MPEYKKKLIIAGLLPLMDELFADPAVQADYEEWLKRRNNSGSEEDT